MDEWEKIEYKPIPVRTLLVEMKNLSELMIDLAYSSALFHSHELAEDVLELEKRVDTLALLLKMNIMIAARDAKDAKDLLGVSLVSSSADKISDAVERVEERLGRFVVKPDSILVNRKLRELKLASRIGVDIIAIRRGKDWIIDPKGNDKILKDDVLIARGAPSGIEELKGLAQGRVKELED